MKQTLKFKFKTNYKIYKYIFIILYNEIVNIKKNTYAIKNLIGNDYIKNTK